MTEKEKKQEVTQLMLKCNLTDFEKQEMGLEIAKAVSNIDELDGKLKAVKADFKSQIEAEELNKNTLARKLRDGFEMRDVDCEIIRDFDAKTVTFVRMDTGENVKTRRMTSDELQMELPN